MKKIYLLSDNFDYSKMITYDAGPGYANNMNWAHDSLRNIHSYIENVNIIDTRLSEGECAGLEKFINTNKDTIFVLTVTDPDREHCIDHWYYDFLSRVKYYKNVFFLSKYIPTEFVKDLDDSTNKEKVVFIPYPFVDRYHISNNLSNRRKKIIVSGSTEQYLYPHRYKFYHHVRKSINPWLRSKVAILQHPDYPDIGRRLKHHIIGSKYVEYLSRFMFMLIAPSKYELELLKYTECAYARCVPLGMVPKSFSEEVNKFFLLIDFENINRSIKSIFSIPVSELNDLANGYYLALSKERNPDLLNRKLEDFLKPRGSM